MSVNRDPLPEAPETVEVRAGDLSVEVAPEFRHVALGVLSLGFDAVDRYRVETGVSIVFVDSEHMEGFSEFLLHHGFFRSISGEPVIHGSFFIDLDDIDGEVCAIPTYHLDVPPELLPALEACLVEHTPRSSPGTLVS